MINVDNLRLVNRGEKVHNGGVINLSPEICRQLKAARLAAGLSQSRLAAEFGCKQSAISMVEQGDGTKLNEDVLQKIAKKFGVELKPAPETAVPIIARPALQVAPGPRMAYCPNALCPSHVTYFVDGRRLLKPDRAQQDPVGGRFCAVCGEILERSCPNCGAPVHEGAICSHCGEPYVAVVG